MKTNSLPAKIILLITALPGWYALIAQFYINISGNSNIPGETIIRYFSYFTLDTNLLVALTCTSLIMFPTTRFGKFFSKQTTQAAVAVYITIVAVVYNTILRNIWDPQGLQAVVDNLLHTIIPVLYVLYWLFFAEKDRLVWKNAFPWMLYPFIYGVLVIFRGSISGFYPYPFIDMDKLGTNKTLINVAVFIVIFLASGWLFIGISKFISSKKR